MYFMRMVSCDQNIELTNIKFKLTDWKICIMYSKCIRAAWIHISKIPMSQI